MKKTKGAGFEGSVSVTADDLAAINEYTKKELTADDVYCFDLLLCDNDVDRDFERFSTESLPTLAALFLGKTGIFDHNWSASGQKARIFKAEVVTDTERRNVVGEPYCYLKARAYMLKTAQNDELIAEIDGGIKREVSVGCAVAKSICSICGEITESAKCGHVKGRTYGGRTCHAVLCEPTDAYEWSFVAVPAQKNAGVIKKFEREQDMKLSEYIRASGDDEYIEKMYELEALAKLGASYMKKLREDVVRLGVMSGSGFDGDFLEKAVSKLDEDELLGFKKCFERKIDEKFPPVCQLSSAAAEKNNAALGEEFRI